MPSLTFADTYMCYVMSGGQSGKNKEILLYFHRQVENFQLFPLLEVWQRKSWKIWTTGQRSVGEILPVGS